MPPAALPPAMRSRLDRTLDVLATLLRLVHALSLFFLILLTLLLSLLLYPLSPLTIPPLLLLSLLSYRSLSEKISFVADLIEDADERTLLPRPHAHALARTLVEKLLQHTLDAAVEAALFAPAACVLVAVLAALFEQNGLAVATTVVAALLTAFIAAAYQLARCTAFAWIDRLWPVREGAEKGDKGGAAADGESVPLLQPEQQV